MKINSETIEVKSSIEKYNSEKENLVMNRRIIIYSNRTLSDYIVQVFYSFKNIGCKNYFTDMEKLSEIDFKNKYTISNEQDFVTQFLQCSPNALIMGYVPKSIALEKIDQVFIYSNKQDSNDNKRNYIDFFIKESLPMSDFINLFS